MPGTSDTCRIGDGRARPLDRIVDGDKPVQLGSNNSGKSVGGSTVHLPWVSLRLRPEWFKSRTLLGYGADWPPQLAGDVGLLPRGRTRPLRSRRVRASSPRWNARGYCLREPSASVARRLRSNTSAAADTFVSCAGFVQPFDRVCIELEARGANDFVELRQ
jgi:hypothetical protein